MDRNPYSDVDDRDPRRASPSGRGAGNAAVWLGVGVGALAGAAGLAYLNRTQRPSGHHPHDSAPGRTAKRRRFGEYAVVGRTVTIDRPRSELYAFWRDFSNLPTFMENVRAVEKTGTDTSRWTIAAPAGRSVDVETRIVEDRENAFISWRSVAESAIDAEGKITFRDAPGGRGTEVEAIVAYKPPAGELGRWIATLFQREPAMQGRRELKRLKMLMETGEIATAANRRAERTEVDPVESAEARAAIPAQRPQAAV
ncbi:MAG: SRPBCC family protein [Lautropia sp.]